MCTILFLKDKAVNGGLIFELTTWKICGKIVNSQREH